MDEDLFLNNLQLKYSIVSIKHLLELQSEINKYEAAGKISHNETIRSYIGQFQYKIPEQIPEAKYMIVVAIENKLAIANFQYQGKNHEIMIPGNYYSRGVISEQEIGDFLLSKIIPEGDYKVVPIRQLHLKYLAVRSGLAKYGRNNITYVNGLGSFVGLHCFFTNYDFQNEKELESLEMMERCENCTICENNCPTKAISRDDFVIDIEKCIPLYNEIPGVIPEWVDSEAHNAFMGCMKCQMYCPENKQAMKNFMQFEDITEEETSVILSSGTDEKLLDSVGKKLHMFNGTTAKYWLPALSRNLKLLLE
ncbi:MAG: 4Fe-4S double cluster binding domain-containing protein [Candidatus Thorarchaeota archaeon]